MARHLHLVASHRLTRVAVGAVLGYLVFHYLIDIGSMGLASGLDTDSWADGFWDGVGGLFGAGTGGSGKKGGDFLDNIGPGESDDSPPSVTFPDDGGPPVISQEDETSYDMFKGVQDFLGEVLGDDYKKGKDKFLDFSSGKGPGDPNKKGKDD